MERSSDPALPDADWAERHYNPRLSVADATIYFNRWATWASQTRRDRPHLANLAYGAHPRERMDLFRADQPRGLVVFIHGGYWRALSKDDHSWVADAFLDHGYSVALITYPLCPEVTVDHIAQCCRRALAQLWSTLMPDEQGNCLITGHSAGGYLTAAMLCTDWQAYGLPPAPFSGAMPISGIFDLAPLRATSINQSILLTAEDARAWSLHARQRLVNCPAIVVVGGAEPAEFQRQSRDMAMNWHLPAHAVRAIDTCNHFTVVEQLRDPSSEVFAIARALLTGQAA